MARSYYYYTETSYAQHWTQRNAKKQKVLVDKDHSTRTNNNNTVSFVGKNTTPTNETIFCTVWKDNDYLIACTSKGWIYIWNVTTLMGSMNTNELNHHVKKDTIHDNIHNLNQQYQHPVFKFQVYHDTNEEEEGIELYSICFTIRDKEDIMMVSGNQGILVAYKWNDIVQQIAIQQQTTTKTPVTSPPTVSTTTTATITPMAQYHPPSLPTSLPRLNNTSDDTIIMGIDIDPSKKYLYAATSNGGYKWNIQTETLMSTFHPLLASSCKSNTKKSKSYHCHGMSRSSTTSSSCVNVIRVVASSWSSTATLSNGNNNNNNNIHDNDNDQQQPQEETNCTNIVLTGGEDGMLNVWNDNDDDQNNKHLECIDILMHMKKEDSSLSITDYTLSSSSTVGNAGTTNSTSAAAVLSNASKCWISTIDIGSSSASSSTEWWIIGGGIVVEDSTSTLRGGGVTTGRLQNQQQRHRPQEQKGFLITLHGPTKTVQSGCITREIPQCIMSTNQGGLLTVGNECVVSYWSSTLSFQKTTHTYSRAWCTPPSVYTISRCRTTTTTNDDDEDYTNIRDEESSIMAIGGSGPFIDIFQGPHTKMLTLSTI